MAQIDSTMVREYDIRGYAMAAPGRTVNLDSTVAQHIGMAMGSRLPAGSTVVITGDARLTSADLRRAVAEGYALTGVNVLTDVQPVPSGVISWYAGRHRLDGSCQITGSHNPSYFNGLKTTEKGNALFGAQLATIIGLIRNERYRRPRKTGSITRVDVVSPYIDMLLAAFPRKLRCRHRIALDAGNGLGGVLVDVLKARGAEVMPLLTEPDGRFPVHLADPSSAEGQSFVVPLLKEANKGVKDASQLWYGLLTDGDADRSGFVDERGTPAAGELLGMVFYQDYLRSLPAGERRKHVLALDVRGAGGSRQLLEAAGGVGLFIGCGYPSHRAFAPVICRKLGKTKAVYVSAESSGHYFFPTAGYDEKGRFNKARAGGLIDDGLFSAITFIYLLDAFGQRRRGKLRNGLLADFLAEASKDQPPSAISPELRIEASDTTKFGVVAEVSERLGKQCDDILPTRGPVRIGDVRMQSPDEGLITVDGLRAQFDDGSWMLVRASNTTPMLVCRVEGTTAKRRDQLLALLRELLSDYPDVNVEPISRLA
jgi:phosphomannomutase